MPSARGPRLPDGASSSDAREQSINMGITPDSSQRTIGVRAFLRARGRGRQRWCSRRVASGTTVRVAVEEHPGQPAGALPKRELPRRIARVIGPGVHGLSLRE